MTERERSIVVVGAGFSGTATAINLLRLASANPLRIVLVDRAQIGRGMAYASREYPYLLNVPAGRMALCSADPSGFVEFARRRLPSVSAEGFLPRALYGEYLEATLRAAELAAPPHIRLVRLRTEVVRLERLAAVGSPHRVHLRDGQRLLADEVVLALGNPPPAPLLGVKGLIARAKEKRSGSPWYVNDPWAEPIPFRPDEAVLVVGTGPTMADVVTSAAHRTGDRIVLHVLSRHGLVPPSQTVFRAPSSARIDPDASMLVAAAAHSARLLTRAVRVLCERTALNGGDWREAITIVRHLAPELWVRMPLAERRRFLRHLRSYWDIHRHRLPAQTLETLNRLRRAHRLHVHAGRVTDLELREGGVRATWQPRGSHSARTLICDRVINCTGPDYDTRRLQDPLVRALIDDGLAIGDPLGLGLTTGRHGALIGRDGQVAPNLYYLGPMLRADSWETTAVPELRQHAELLACHLVRRHETRATTGIPRRTARGRSTCPRQRLAGSGESKPRCRHCESISAE